MSEELIEAANLEVLESECYCQTEEPSLMDMCTPCLVRKLAERIEALERERNEAREQAQIWRWQATERGSVLALFPWEESSRPENCGGEAGDACGIDADGFCADCAATEESKP